MREILNLSSNPKLGVYHNSKRNGHDVQLLEPKLIAGEIKRVYEFEVKRAA